MLTHSSRHSFRLAASIRANLPQNINTLLAWSVSVLFLFLIYGTKHLVNHSSNTRPVTKPLVAKLSFAWLSGLGSFLMGVSNLMVVSVVVEDVAEAGTSSDWLSARSPLLSATLKLSGYMK